MSVGSTDPTKVSKFIKFKNWVTRPLQGGGPTDRLTVLNVLLAASILILVIVSVSSMSGEYAARNNQVTISSVSDSPDLTAVVTRENLVVPLVNVLSDKESKLVVVLHNKTSPLQISSIGLSSSPGSLVTVNDLVADSTNASGLAMKFIADVSIKHGGTIGNSSETHTIDITYLNSTRQLNVLSVDFQWYVKTLDMNPVIYFSIIVVGVVASRYVTRFTELSKLQKEAKEKQDTATAEWHSASREVESAEKKLETATAANENVEAVKDELAKAKVKLELAEDKLITNKEKETALTNKKKELATKNLESALQEVDNVKNELAKIERTMSELDIELTRTQKEAFPMSTVDPGLRIEELKNRLADASAQFEEASGRMIIAEMRSRYAEKELDTATKKAKEKEEKKAPDIVFELVGDALYMILSGVIALLILSSFQQNSSLTNSILLNIGAAFGFGFGFSKVLDVTQDLKTALSVK